MVHVSAGAEMAFVGYCKKNKDNSVHKSGTVFFLFFDGLAMFKYYALK